MRTSLTKIRGWGPQGCLFWRYEPKIGPCLLNQSPIARKPAAGHLNGDAPLAVWREHRQLSQAELARQSGVNRVQIVDIEAGRKTGSVASLRKLATALQVDMDDLVVADNE